MSKGQKTKAGRGVQRPLPPWYKWLTQSSFWILSCTSPERVIIIHFQIDERYSYMGTKIKFCRSLVLMNVHRKFFWHFFWHFLVKLAIFKYTWLLWSGITYKLHPSFELLLYSTSTYFYEIEWRYSFRRKTTSCRSLLHVYTR